MTTEPAFIRVGSDLGKPGGDKTAHTIVRRVGGGPIEVLAAFTHEPGEWCQLCGTPRETTAGYLGYCSVPDAPFPGVTVLVGKNLLHAQRDTVAYRCSPAEMSENRDPAMQREIIRSRFEASIRSMQRNQGLPVGVATWTLDELCAAADRAVGR